MQLGELSRDEMYQSCMDYCHTHVCGESNQKGNPCFIEQFCRGLNGRRAEENEPDIRDIERAYEKINRKK